MATLLLMFNLQVLASNNLSSNSGFEKFASGMPSDWSSDLYSSTDNSTKFYIDPLNPHSGKYCVTIESKTANDAKLTQKIKVKSNAIYKLSCYVKAENINKDKLGANISVIGINDTSTNLYNTQGKWEYIEIYGKTDKDQTSLNVSLRLGGYGNLNIGKASFDDFSVEEIQSPPTNVKVVNFFAINSKPSDKQTDAKTNPNMSNIIFTSVLYLLLFALCMLAIKYKDKLKKYIHKKEIFTLFFLIICALIVKIIFAATNAGYQTDIGCFEAWAAIASKNGLAHFYTSTSFVDYPPAYIYILYLIGKIQTLFNISGNSVNMLILIKLPSIIADIICSMMIFKVANKRTDSITAIVICALYTFNPAVIFNSSVWGQVDGFFTLFIVLMVLFIMDEKLILASFIFIIAVLIKPQALIFTPLLIYAFISKKNLKIFVYSIIVSIASFIILILPFSLNQKFYWIFVKYFSTLSSYPYGSLNAFNLFSLLGGNWVSDNNTFLLLPFKYWGSIFIVLIVAFSLFVYLKSKHSWKSTYIAFFIISAVFVLTSKMHERYMFPAIILALLWYIYSLNKKALYLFVGFSITEFINVAYVYIGAQKGNLYISNTDPVLIFISLINVLLVIYVIKIGFDNCNDNTISSNQIIESKVTKKESVNLFNALNKKESFKFSKKDIIFLSTLILIYSVLAFVNLGSTNVPQSYWKPSAPGESVSIDFGEQNQIDSVSYYFGLGSANYQLSYSKDSVNWSNSIQLNQSDIYNWYNSPLNIKTRYVKLNVVKPDGMINEISFLGQNNKVPIKIKNITKNDISIKDVGKPENIFDEQNTVQTNKSFLTGTYFDEIYFAQTAFDQLNKLEPMEWTHPPLGKSLIAAGIVLFGMNPFGWRFVGTIFGILMIAVMYLFGKRLFKKSEFAFIAAFLMTFDFMHFTQTRIATVDVFAVMFIILMYYFMYKFTQLNVYKDDFKKVLTQLALCGIFFALGISTKWIGFYAAIGLAVIFFTYMFMKYIEYNKAQKYLKYSDKHRDKEKLESFGLFTENYKVKTIKIFGICVAFFILIPAIVYFISYIPFLMVPGLGHSFADVLKYQYYMFSYHDTLTATHPFSSPWWQWPFMGKPIWYYAGQGLSLDKISSIVCFGNPAIWWVGAVSFISVLIIGIKHKDAKACFIVIAGLSQYLPWLLVPRITFIYHYFATLPFVMLSIVYMIAYFYKKYSKAKYFVYFYLSVVLLLFVMFYPVISGMVVDKAYVANFLKWFNSWYFFS
jgi:dolichyl-phosphate-mannose-protein mannosyltransferase